MKTYQKAANLLNGRARKKLAPHTWASKESGGAVSIVFWNTEIIRVYLNGDVLASHGGFKTVTTKARINWLLGEVGIRWGIFQKSGVWYWDKYLGNGKHSKSREFSYRNTFNANGKLLCS